MNTIAYDFLDIEEDYKIIERDTEDVLLSLNNLNTYIGKTAEISNNIDKIDNESDMEKARLSTLIENDLEDIGMIDLDLADIEEAKESFASKSIETVKKFFAMIWKKIKELISKMTGNTKKIDKVVEQVAKKVRVKQEDIKVREIYDRKNGLASALTAFSNRYIGYITLKGITSRHDMINQIMDDYDIVNGINLPKNTSGLNKKIGIHEIAYGEVSYFYLEDEVKKSVYRTKSEMKKPFDADLPTPDENYEQYANRVSIEFKKILERLDDFVSQTKKESDRLLHLRSFEVGQKNPNGVTVMRLGQDISKGLMDRDGNYRLTRDDLGTLELIEADRISILTSIVASFSKLHKNNLSRLSRLVLYRVEDLNAE